MNRTRIFAVLLIAIVAGGGLAYGTYDYLQNGCVSRSLSARNCRSGPA